MFMETDAASMTGAGGANMTEMSAFELGGGGGGDATLLNTSMSTEDMAASSDRGTRLKAAFALCCKQVKGGKARNNSS